MSTRGVTSYLWSGIVVDAANDSTVLTAGHCMHDGTTDGTGQCATNWTFVPAYDGKATIVAPYGRCALRPPAGWPRPSPTSLS